MPFRSKFIHIPDLGALQQTLDNLDPRQIVLLGKLCHRETDFCAGFLNLQDSRMKLHSLTFNLFFALAFCVQDAPEFHAADESSLR